MPEQSNTTQSTSQNHADGNKKAYHAPRLTEHGDLRELTLTNTGVGPDGGAYDNAS